MKDYQVTHEEFSKNVAEHKVNIIRDEGLYRHVRFKKDGSTNRYFDLITWPGHLCYTGDMGTYVFSRIEDMFHFFDTSPDTFRINPSYWAEKVLASDKCDCVEEFSASRFRECIEEYLQSEEEDVADEDYAEEYMMELRQSVSDEILYYVEDNNEQMCYNNAYNFSFSSNGRDFQFYDLFENNFKKFTGRYIWACYALVWGIQQYNLTKQKVEEYV